MYIIETVEWLRSAQDQKAGGWGVYYGDEQHPTITGEVVSALRDHMDDELRRKGRACLERRLNALGPTFDGVRSIAHLCWIVEGALNVDVPVDHSGVARMLDELEASRQYGGWGWQLGSRGTSQVRVYPTLLAVRLLRHAQEAGRPVTLPPPDASKTLAAALLTPLAESSDVAEHAYAIQALCLLGAQDTVREPDVKAMLDACARLSPSDVFFREAVSLDDQNYAFDWSHSVLQQVLLATLAFKTQLIEHDPAPQLFVRVFNESIRGQDWYDPSRQCAAPYVASDSMALMARWRRRAATTDSATRVLRLLGEERRGRSQLDAGAPQRAQMRSRSIERWIAWVAVVVVLGVSLAWPSLRLSKLELKLLLAAVFPLGLLSGWPIPVGRIAVWATLAGLVLAVLLAIK